jgi:flagellar protein FlbD
MIKITDASGAEKYINCDLIEKIEKIPETRVMLLNGRAYIVQESPEELIRRVVEFKKLCAASGG